MSDNITNTNESGEEVMVTSTNPTTEPHIVVGTDKFITIPEELKKLGIEGEHNIETLTWDCPRYWDEHDLSTMTIYINFELANGTPGTTICKNIVVDETDESMIHFDWVIDGAALEQAGKVKIAACAEVTDEEGTILHSWSTEINDDCFVSKGLRRRNYVASQYPSIVTDLLTRMAAVEQSLNITVTETEAGKVATLSDENGVVMTYLV